MITMRSVGAAAGWEVEIHDFTLNFLREMTPGTGGSTAETSEPEKDEANRGGIFCRRCGWRITEESNRITVNGLHHHTFFNPAGLLFELGCFRYAPGCLVLGEASSDFSWFAGYLWRVAFCGQCSAHLGWRFENQHATFFSLIIPYLKEDG
jgi:hypothetical protein